MINYQQGQDRDQVFMMSMDQWVPADSLARVIDQYVNDIDLEKFGFKSAKVNKGGNQAYHPKDMLKLILFAYRKGMRSAQKIANMARFNVETMWLMKGLHPSSRTINYFRAKNAKAISKASIYVNKKIKKLKTAGD